MSLLDLETPYRMYTFLCYVKEHNKVILRTNKDTQEVILDWLLADLWEKLKTTMSPGREPIPRHVPKAPQRTRTIRRATRAPRDTLFAVVPGAACQTAKNRVRMASVAALLLQEPTLSEPK